MTSSSLIVLSLALVCSIFGTALEQTFDHGNHSEAHSVMTSIVRKHELIHEHHHLNMKTTRTNIANNNYRNVNNNDNRNKNFKTSDYSRENVNNNHDNNLNTVKYDEIFTADESNEDLKNYNRKSHRTYSYMNSLKKRKNDDVNYYFKTVSNNRQYNKEYLHFNVSNKREKRQTEEHCEQFKFKRGSKSIMHPHSKNNVNSNYYKGMDCTTTISVNDGEVIRLTFIDMFHIEEHPDCAYDYLEIRDGQYGFSKLLGKFCGSMFPQQLKSSSPNLWLKFHSDDTIEYEGFNILIEAESSSTSHSIPRDCYKEMGGTHGVIDSADIPAECKKVKPLDMLWNITTEENTKIYLNFTSYLLLKPNECEENLVQVFGSVLEYPARLAHYCGSMANAVSTKDPDDEGKKKNEKGNVMFVRMYATLLAEGSAFNATYTAYRTLDTANTNDQCDQLTEFDCEDNTCIDIKLLCDHYAHCRLKADEDVDRCKGEAESMIAQPHIMVILVIFSLILSGMSFVFLFKCIRKLYQDHKIIKEHIRQSCEDRLDTLVSSRLTLDAKRLERDSEPRERASLERENHTNEMFKRQRNNFSQHKPTSIDSDYVVETQLDVDDEPWRREVEPPALIETAEVRIEKNGRSRRSDISRKEESMRKDSRSVKEKIEEDVREKKEIRDASVGAPDTKESGCQTRESLFQAEGMSPDGTESGSGSRGFSTFGYSGATIARPSPPVQANNTSQITIELLRTMPPKQESRTWTDMTIEQSLMKSMKTAGGLTQGRGYSDDVLGKWVLGLPILHYITETVEKFCDFGLKDSLHKDGTKSRIERDAKDIHQFADWFSEHNPFPVTEDIMSISTGIVGNIDVNPHNAKNIGQKMMNVPDGTTYGQIKDSRKATIKSLATVSSAVAVQDVLVPIEPDQIFKRIAFIKKTQEELKEFLKYELSPYPLSLFDQTGMRKSKKSILYAMFTPVSEENLNDVTRAYVIHGGYLLHKVVWQKGSTFETICQKYVNYIKAHYNNTTVVFDGYEKELNVKNQERKRRTAKGQLGPEIVILNSQTEATVSQESFLSNGKNKNRFISLLTPYLEAEGISVCQSCDDADTLIVTKAAEISQTNQFDCVIIVGEDVDLLAIVTSINCSNLYMLKPGKGRVCTKLYNSKSFTGDPQSILFWNAFTGCDSTSAIYRQGKKRACNIITKNNALNSVISIFNDAQATPDDVASAGEVFFCHLYGKETADLNSLRYEKFVQLITKNKLDLASLPPSKSAARMHSLRAYYQIQKWRSNDLNPTSWGWERNRSFLSPILTRDKPAPDEIMKMISCKCKSTCKGNCTCIKTGLLCTELCIFCTDKVCNGEKNITEEAEYDERFEVEINNLKREDILNDSKQTFHESEEEIFATLATNNTNLQTTSRTSNPDICEWIDMDLSNTSYSDQPETKKLSDRRPMSTETTRSAPDVIIVSKPIR